MKGRKDTRRQIVEVLFVGKLASDVAFSEMLVKSYPLRFFLILVCLPEFIELITLKKIQDL